MCCYVKSKNMSYSATFFLALGLGITLVTSLSDIDCPFNATNTAQNYVDEEMFVNAKGVYFQTCPKSVGFAWVVSETSTCSSSGFTYRDICICDLDTDCQFQFPQLFTCRKFYKSVRFDSIADGCTLPQMVEGTSTTRFTGFNLQTQDVYNIESSENSYTVLMNRTLCEGEQSTFWVTAAKDSVIQLSNNHTCSCCSDDICSPAMLLAGLESDSQYNLTIHAETDCLGTNMQAAMALAAVPRTKARTPNIMAHMNASNEAVKALWTLAKTDCVCDPITFNMDVVDLYTSQQYIANKSIDMTECYRISSMSLLLTLLPYRHFLARSSTCNSNGICGGETSLDFRTEATEALMLSDFRVETLCDSVEISFLYGPANCTGPTTFRSTATDSNGIESFSQNVMFGDCAIPDSLVTLKMTNLQCNETYNVTVAALVVSVGLNTIAIVTHISTGIREPFLPNDINISLDANLTAELSLLVGIPCSCNQFEGLIRGQLSGNYATALTSEKSFNYSQAEIVSLIYPQLHFFRTYNSLWLQSCIDSRCLEKLFTVNITTPPGDPYPLMLSDIVVEGGTRCILVSLNLSINNCNGPMLLHIKVIDQWRNLTECDQSIELNLQNWVNNTVTVGQLHPFTTYTVDVTSGPIRHSFSKSTGIEEAHTIDDGHISLSLIASPTISATVNFTDALCGGPTTIDFTLSVLDMQGSLYPSEEQYRSREQIAICPIDFDIVEVTFPAAVHAYRRYKLTLIPTTGAGSAGETSVVSVTPPAEAENLQSSITVLNATETTIKLSFDFYHEDCYGPTYFVVTFMMNGTLATNNYNSSSFPYCPTYGKISTEVLSVSSLQPGTQYNFSFTPLTDKGSHAKSIMVAGSTSITEQLYRSSSGFVWYYVVIPVLVCVLLLGSSAIAVFRYRQLRSLTASKSKSIVDEHYSRPIEVADFLITLTLLESNMCSQLKLEHEELEGNILQTRLKSDTTRKSCKDGYDYVSYSIDYSHTVAKHNRLAVHSNYIIDSNSRDSSTQTYKRYSGEISNLFDIVVEQRVKIAVALTNCDSQNAYENNTAYYCPASVGQTLYFGDYGVTLVSEEYMSPTHNLRQLKLSKGNVAHMIQLLLYKEDPFDGVPTSEKMLDFVHNVQKLTDSKKNPSSPVLVQSSGDNSSAATFIVLDQLLQQCDSGAESIDVYGTTYQLGQRCHKMIPNKKDYHTIYRTVAQAVRHKYFPDMQDTPEPIWDEADNIYDEIGDYYCAPVQADRYTFTVGSCASDYQLPD